MKLRLSPTLSYLIGLWKHSRTREGLGIVGNEAMRTAFLSKVIEAGLTPADKVVVEDNAAYFHHTAYRAFFEQIIKEETERFCHANDFSAAFLAGLYDSNGGTEKGKLYLGKWDQHDEMVLLRLNFMAAKAGGRLWVGPADVFLKFTKEWRQVDRPTVRVERTDRRGPMMKRAVAREKEIEFGKKEEKTEERKQ
jgi:hypothetical protein